MLWGSVWLHCVTHLVWGVGTASPKRLVLELKPQGWVGAGWQEGRGESAAGSRSPQNRREDGGSGRNLVVWHGGGESMVSADTWEVSQGWVKQRLLGFILRALGATAGFEARKWHDQVCVLGRLDSRKPSCWELLVEPVRMLQGWSW